MSTRDALLIPDRSQAKLDLTAEGRVKLSGNEVTVDALREIRLASARVEVP